MELFHLDKLTPHWSAKSAWVENCGDHFGKKVFGHYANMVSTYFWPHTPHVFVSFLNCCECFDNLDFFFFFFHVLIRRSTRHHVQKLQGGFLCLKPSFPQKETRLWPENTRKCKTSALVRVPPRCVDPHSRHAVSHFHTLLLYDAFTLHLPDEHKYNL